MFSKNKRKPDNKKQTASPTAPAVSAGAKPQPAPSGANKQTPPTTAQNAPSKPATNNGVTMSDTAASAKPKNLIPSVLSSDLFVKGDVETSGDIQIEGKIKGNIRAHLLTIGENAVVDGEVRADDATVHGTIKGTLRGYKVRLSSSARVEGDIIHKTIAIESGAHFQGSVMRDDDPTQDGDKAKSASKSASSKASSSNS